MNKQFWIMFAIAVLIFGVMIYSCRAEEINIERLANAIYIAEGGANTNHPYGILQKYKTTTPRQACVNTINSVLKRFEEQEKEKDFIHFLSLTYCPINAKNDPLNLNVHWEKNVKYYYERR